MRLVPGVVLGLGMGGFIDGIVLHQIAQWHNMGSAVVSPHTRDAMRQNMVWDGEFHLGAWVLTLIGIVMLWNDRSASAPTQRVLIGQLILGWGAFNLIEGAIDHHLLGIHHIRDMPVHIPLYDWLFLGIAGVGFILVGVALSGARRVSRAMR
jgi:uncharacterized membrane protein